MESFSFGRASKYVIWSGVEICHLAGLENILFGNMSFGRATKYVIRSVVENELESFSFGRASKYVIWQGSKTFHLVICHLVERRNMSFGR